MTAVDATRVQVQSPVRVPARTVAGTCHHDCPDSCGWQVTVEERSSGPVAVQLRGNPAHPFSAGELCPKVNRFLDRVYSTDRVLTPLRRLGRKGEGRFVPISWADALAEIATRLTDIVDRHGPEAIVPFASAGNQSVLAMGFPQRFWNRLGATRVEMAICGSTAGAGVAITNGTAKALDPVELRHARLIVLWGTNTRLTNRHLWPFVDEARRAGARVVVIDPYRTVTADAADQFVQPVPGTDTALALALMHVIVRDDLIDHEWVAAHTSGFAELAGHLRSWTPERAAAITGVDPAEITALAHEYATAQPSAIRTLIGAEHHEHGAMFYRTVACLPALVGAWRHRGGGLARSTGAWTSEHVDQRVLTRPDLLAGRRPRRVNMSRLGEVLTALDDPRVMATVVWSSNPAVVVPNSELVRRGLERDDLFTVVHDQFVTDTARYADLVLPATTQIESSDVVMPWGHLHLGWNEAAVPPLGESVSNSELHRRLATAMGFTEPELFEDDLAVLRAAMPSVDLDELRTEGWVRAAHPSDGRPYADGRFPTRSGRVELVSDALVAMGQPRVPTYTPARESLAGDPAMVARHPFMLLTPKRHTRFLNSSYSHLPKHGALEGEPYVEICPADADALGLADGDLARVWNERASLTLRVRIGDRVRSRMIAVPWGWWQSAHLDGRTANALTNDTIVDWGGGVAFGDTLVSVERA